MACSRGRARFNLSEGEASYLSELISTGELFSNDLYRAFKLQFPATASYKTIHNCFKQLIDAKNDNAIDTTNVASKPTVVVQHHLGAGPNPPQSCVTTSAIITGEVELDVTNAIAALDSLQITEAVVELNRTTNESDINASFIDFLSTHDEAFQLDMCMDDFLDRFAFTPVTIARDGHCFLNCIRLFFQTFLSDVDEWTTSVVQDNFLRLMSLPEQAEFVTDDLEFENECEGYFDKREYDSSVCDLIVDLRVKLFSIKIVIVDGSQPDKLCVHSPRFPTNMDNPYPDHTVVVMRDAQPHFSLLVPNASLFMFEQESADVEDVAGDTGTPKPKPKRRSRPCLTQRRQDIRRANQAATYQANKTATDRQTAISKNREQRAHARLADRLAHTGFGVCNGYIDESLPQFEEHYLGRMDQVCSSCGALHWEAERTSGSTNFTSCCGKGKVKLEPNKAPPAELQKLFERRKDYPCHRLHANFMRNIVKYNNSMATASMICDIFRMPGPSTDAQKHNPTFTVHGQINHQVSSLYAEPGAQPSFAQYFCLDTDQAIIDRMRSKYNHGCIKELFQIIQRIFDTANCNSLMMCYKRMHELEEEYKEAAKLGGYEYAPTVRMYLGRVKAGQHPGCFSQCQQGDIAAVFQSDNGSSPPSNFSVIVHARDGTNKTYLGRKNPNIDAMCFPLIFPYCDPGWHHKMQHESQTTPLNSRPGAKTHTRLTCNEFYSYRLHPRTDNDHLFNGGKLFQKFVVDAFVKDQNNTLDYYRYTQAQLRVDTYSGLHCYVEYLRTREQRGSSEPVIVGYPVVLPSSFTWGPRAINQHYLNGMTMARHLGAPSFFITFTCNPHWREIQEVVQPLGQKWHERPDIITRVFQLKLRQLIEELVKKGVCSEMEAYLNVIEYQLRGLPHAHMVFWVIRKNKITTTVQIDAVVCAEIPCKVKNPRLYKIVSERMIHGPCTKAFHLECRRGPDNEVVPCKKMFPKELVQESLLQEDGRATYRRRRSEHTVSNNYSNQVNNQWVVAYNPYLLLRFNAHINFEIANGHGSIKYLFKYCYKGHDSANVVLVKAKPGNKERVTHIFDEIKWYMLARIVGSTEGCWRLFDFKMHDRSHSVLPLKIHLPDGQSILFTLPLSDADLEKARLRRTHLLAWFELNRFDSEARKYKITELTQHYVYNNYQNQWTRRQRGHGKQLCRLPHINPRQDQLYFMRTLLLHVTGAESFEDIRTYKNVVYDTFQAACVARGLLRNDLEWMRCMEDASAFQMPVELRNLFVMICVNQIPQDALAILGRFKTQMSEDFARLTADENLIYNMLLDSLVKTFERHDSDHRRFAIPDPDRELLDRSPFINAAHFINTSSLTTEEHAVLAKEFVDSLNTEQRRIFDLIMYDVYDHLAPRAKCSFIDGPGGCGKTFLFKALLHTCRSQGWDVVCVAWTGMAAELIDGGRTAHSTFRLPLNLHEESITRLNGNSKQGIILRRARLILWDEASQVPVHAYMCVNRLLKELVKSGAQTDAQRELGDQWFGGKPFTLGGDFRQTTPIATSGNQLDTLALCLCYHPMWHEFHKHHLTENMRADKDAVDYKEYMLKIGNGELPVIDDYYGVVLDQRLILPPDQSMIDWVYGGHLAPEQVRAERRAILTPLNETCFNLNDKILDMVPGEAKSYLSCDKLLDYDESSTMNDDYVPEETLNLETPTGMPQHHLRLKVNAVIMLIKNIDSSIGLSNGTRLMVLELKDNVIVAEIIGGVHRGRKVFLSRTTIDNSQSTGGCVFKFSRHQFPVRLAYAMTICKAQGQTFDRVGLYFPEPVFGHGQLYVGSSRTRGWHALRIQVLPSSQQGVVRNVFTYTQNVVYLDLLAKAGIRAQQGLC